MLLGTNMKLCMPQLEFFFFFFLIYSPKMEKNGPEIGFFEFIEKFGR